MLDKAVAVLNAVAKDPCGLAELCNRTGLPRATAHRLAVGLEVHRLLRRGSDGRWRPGAALAELAGGATDPLLDAASSVLPRLREEIESVVRHAVYEAVADELASGAPPAPKG